jgi:hypothetical protein
MVHQNTQGEISILYKNRPLEFTIFHKPERQAEVVDCKNLNHQTAKRKPPAADHPWRGRRPKEQPTKEVQAYDKS